MDHIQHDMARLERLRPPERSGGRGCGVEQPAVGIDEQRDVRDVGDEPAEL
jgi:hypothetical protein